MQGGLGSQATELLQVIGDAEADSVSSSGFGLRRQLAVMSANQNFLVSQIAVQVTDFVVGAPGDATIPRIKVYLGSFQRSNFINGSNDARIWSTETRILLKPNMYLTVFFDNLLDPASTLQVCTATAYGAYVDKEA